MDKLKEIWGVVKSTTLNVWDEFKNEFGFLIGTIQVAGVLTIGGNVFTLIGGVLLILMTVMPVWNKYKG